MKVHRILWALIAIKSDDCSFDKEADDWLYAHNLAVYGSPDGQRGTELTPLGTSILNHVEVYAGQLLTGAHDTGQMEIQRNGI